MSQEDLIRQRIRQSLQQRLPPLGQLPQDSDRQSFFDNESGGALQSFGNMMGSASLGMSGGVPLTTSDFFNSDSFRATITSHEHRNELERPQQPLANHQPVRETKIIDLQNARPPLTQNTANQAQVLIQQHPLQQTFQMNKVPDEQQQQQNMGDLSDRSMGQQNSEGSNGQLSPLNQDEFIFQQQMIERLVDENQYLKQEIDKQLLVQRQQEEKHQIVEAKLKQTQGWIKEIGGIKDKLEQQLKSSNNGEYLNQLNTENEILKSKIQDLETSVNTLSRNGDESRVEERYKFELKKAQDEKQVIAEKCQMMQQQIIQREQEAFIWKEQCQEKDKEISELQNCLNELQEEVMKTRDECSKLQNKLGDFEGEQQSSVQQKEFVEARGQAPLDRNYASIRNRSVSGDKGTEQFMKELKSYNAEKGQLSQNMSMNHNSKENYQQKNESHINSLDNSHLSHEKIMTPQMVQNNINVKNFQPIHISIASPSDQTLALDERCKKLEEYCRELIGINKILDLENRIAIAQIINLTQPQTQLQNLSSALTFIGQSGKIYDQINKPNGQPASKSLGRSTKKATQILSMQSFNSRKTLQIHKEQSYQNLQNIRQSGAPPISLVYQNNNSTLISNKVRELTQSQSHSLLGSQKSIKDLKRPTLYSNASHNDLKNPQAYMSLGYNQLKSNNSQAAASQSNFSQYQGNLSQHSDVVQNPHPPRVQSANFENTRPQQESRVSNILNLLDINLNALEKEVLEKTGQRLPIKKVQDGFYQLGEHIVNLQLNESSHRIEIRVKTSEDQQLHGLQNKLEQSTFVDFIDFLIQHGYISE